MNCGGRRLGWVIGESTPSRSVVLFDREAGNVRAGLYVTAYANGECVLGILERIVSGNPLLPEHLRDAEEVQGLSRYPELGGRLYKRGVIRWLSLAEPLARYGKLEAPRTPVDPSTEVYEAPREILRSIFAGSGLSWVEIGHLITDENVRVGIDVNKLTRHLAILAVTGGGKSNTVCVLAERIVRGLKGTIVVFDMHGEYSRSDIVPGSQKVIKPRIHPYSLSFAELLKLTRMPPSATNQERILREAWRSIRERYLKGEITRGNFMDSLMAEVKMMLGAKGADKSAVYGVLNRLDDVIEYYGDVIDENAPTSLTSIIEPGKLNIFDLSDVDENGADAVVSHYLRRILFERKRAKLSGGQEGYPVPVLVVIEEAHVLIPRDASTLTKTWASRVAREGRKFGVGLVLVSQRPKGLDPDVLSQTNNKIILRIVEPTDQRYVQQASEQLSEDLLELLPDLNPGEAVVLGSMVKIPALVKIDLCRASTGGSDIDMASEWVKWAGFSREIEEELVEDLRDMAEL